MIQVEVVIPDEETNQFAGLCHDYWRLTDGGAFESKVSELAAAHDIKLNLVSKIVKEHCEARLLSHRCPRCSNPVIVRTRAELSSIVGFAPRTCQLCLAQEAQSRREFAQAEATSKREKIAARFAVVSNPNVVLRATDLDLDQAFALAALLEDGDEVSSGITRPLRERATAVCPTKGYESDLIAGLVNNGHLRIHPDSALDAFVWEDGEYDDQYYPDAVSFYLPGDGSLGDRVSLYLESFNSVVKQQDWPSRWHEQFSSFWTDLCTSECEAYLIRCLRKRNLDFRAGEKTRDTVRRGLQWFSLGQMYYFIWRAAAGAADYYARGEANKSQAANSAVTRLGGAINSAYSGGYSIPTYQRGRGDEESMLWHLVVVRALSLPDPMSFSLVKQTRSAIGLNWAKLDSEGFERLIFQMVDEAEGYEEVQWLMRTNAPDHGRDVSALRILKDSLSGHRQFRVVIQCKHWLSKSVRDDEISSEVVSIQHWEHPPFDVLVVATSGRFTADAVTWVERHNSKGSRPYVELWNDAHLESLLSERQHIILTFELR